MKEDLQLNPVPGFVRPVIVYDASRGYYWRQDSKGYTACAAEAGIYELDRVPGLCPERKMEPKPVPLNHVLVVWAKDKQAAEDKKFLEWLCAENEVTGMANFMMLYEGWQGDEDLLTFLRKGYEEQSADAKT